MSRIIGTARCNCNACDREMVKLEAWPQFWFHVDDGSLSCMDQKAIKVNIDTSGTIRTTKSETPNQTVDQSSKLRKWIESQSDKLLILEKRVDKLAASATDALDVLKCRIDSVSDIVQNGMDDNKSSIESLRTKIESIENCMVETDRYNAEVDKYNEETETEFEQFKGMVDDILKRLEPVEKTCDGLLGRKSLEPMSNQQHATLEEVDARLKTMEEFAESDDREERLQELEQDKIERDEYNEGIKKYNAQIRADFDTLKTTVTDLTRDVWYLKTASTMLNQRVDTLTKTVDWFSAEPSDAEVEEGSGIENRLAEVESFKERVEDWVDGADQQFAELRLLEQKVKTLTNIITRLNAEPLKTAAERLLAKKVGDLAKRVDPLDMKVKQRDYAISDIVTRLKKVEEFMQMAASDDDDQTED